MVTDQTPVASSFVIGYAGLPSISPMSSTVFALGARKRTVTVLSGFTCGETTCTPRPPPRAAARPGRLPGRRRRGRLCAADRRRRHCNHEREYCAFHQELL